MQAYPHVRQRVPLAVRHRQDGFRRGHQPSQRRFVVPVSVDWLACRAEHKHVLGLPPQCCISRLLPLPWRRLQSGGSGIPQRGRQLYRRRAGACPRQAAKSSCRLLPLLRPCPRGR